MLFSKLVNTILLIRKEIGQLKLQALTIIMIISIHFFPEKAYLFSWRKHLPKKKNKFFLKDKKQLPFDIEQRYTNFKENYDEINVVAKGHSFDLQKVKNFKLPTFFVGFWAPLQIGLKNNIEYNFLHEAVALSNLKKHKQDIERYYKRKISFKEFRDLSRKYRFELDKKKNNKYENVYQKKNFFYVTPNPSTIKKFLSNGCNVVSLETFEKKLNSPNAPLTNQDKNNPFEVETNYNNLCEKFNIPRISVIDLIYKPPRPSESPRHSPHNSVICCLSGLGHFAKKINVYGWDFYLESSPKNLTYFNLLKSLFNKNFINFRDPGHAESAIVNYYYGYHFSKLEKFNIEGYLGGFESSKFIEKIERVLFIKN